MYLALALMLGWETGNRCISRQCQELLVVGGNLTSKVYVTCRVAQTIHGILLCLMHVPDNGYGWPFDPLPQPTEHHEAFHWVIDRGRMPNTASSTTAFSSPPVSRRTLAQQPFHEFSSEQSPQFAAHERHGRSIKRRSVERRLFSGRLNAKGY